MKNKKIYYFVVLLLLMTFSTGYAQQFGVESQHLQLLYRTLPQKLQQEIVPQKNNIQKIPIDTILKDATIVVQHNDKKQLQHLGLSLTFYPSKNDSLVEKYTERLFLYILFSTHQSNVLNYIKHYGIKTNNSSSSLNRAEWQRIIKSLYKATLSITQEKGLFIVSKNSTANPLAITFPIDINLITGMNKAELEQKMLSKIQKNRNHKLAAPQKPVVDRKIKPYKDNLYIAEGANFEIDNFRGDRYLRKHNTQYQPIFSDQYPAESFANLFLEHIKENILINATFKLYKNTQKQIKTTLPIWKNSVEEYMMPYIGISEVNQQTLSATIIYHHPIYNYLHMMVAKVDRKEFFIATKPTIEAQIYLYIPRADLKK